MRMSIFILIFTFLIFDVCFQAASASPPPTAIERAKLEAVLEIEGIVVNDRLLKDTTKEKQAPTQLRQFTLNIERVIRDMTGKQGENEQLKITYSYIPQWNSLEYDGPKHVDVMSGDKIHIWLKYGANGLEPALSGNTIEHLTKIQPRVEPIEERLTHRTKRILRLWFNRHLSLLAALALLITLIVILSIGVSRARRQEGKNG